MDPLLSHSPERSLCLPLQNHAPIFVSLYILDSKKIPKQGKILYIPTLGTLITHPIQLTQRSLPYSLWPI